MYQIAQGEFGSKGCLGKAKFYHKNDGLGQDFFGFKLFEPLFLNKRF